jgi:surface protein
MKPFIFKIMMDNTKELALELDCDTEHDFVIDWGNGKVERYEGEYSCISSTYEKIGEYTVTISGTVGTMRFSYESLPLLTEVVDLGDCDWFDLSHMFCNCVNLRSFSGGVTTNVNTMSKMFKGATSLEYIDLSSFNTSNVKSMYRMFSDVRKCTSLDLRSFDTSKITAMSYMFFNMVSLEEVNLSSFRTPEVKFVKKMFSGFRNIKTLDISSFRLNDDVDTKSIFAGSIFNKIIANSETKKKHFKSMDGVTVKERSISNSNTWLKSLS